VKLDLSTISYAFFTFLQPNYENFILNRHLASVYLFRLRKKSKNYWLPLGNITFNLHFCADGRKTIDYANLKRMLYNLFVYIS